MNEYPEHDEIVNGPNPQSPPRSNRRAGVIGLVAAGGLAAGAAALYVANAAGAAPSSATSSAPSSTSSPRSTTPGSTTSGSTTPGSTSSGSMTCVKPFPGPRGRPGGGPAAAGPGRGAVGAARAARAAGADGRITAVSSTSLAVRDLFAKSHTYKITSATVVHSGPARSVKVSALSVGEHVVVRTSSSTSTATEIDVRPAHIDGAVSAVTSTAVTVTDPDGFMRTIDTDGQTKYTLNSASSNRSKIIAGTVVHAEGKVDADGTALDAASVDIVTAAKTPPGRPIGAGPRPCAPVGGHGPGGPGHRAGAPGAPKPSTSGSGTPATPTPSATTTP